MKSTGSCHDGGGSLEVEDPCIRDRSNSVARVICLTPRSLLGREEYGERKSERN